jgi:Flp pilus assembly pilin Flp
MMAKHFRGASLIEVGVVLLFMSLAMAPIVSSMGGKLGSGKSGAKAIALNEATRDGDKQLAVAGACPLWRCKS